MVTDVIDILPLIKNLRAEFPDITQPWYAENSGALVIFVTAELYFNFLKELGRYKGINLKPSKIVLIVHPDNLKSGKMFVLCHGFKVCTGACYLGLFIGDDESKRDWLKERTEMWEQKIHTISKTAGKYTQESYAFVIRAIQ